MKVLVVEDEERLGRMLKRSLSEHAHTVNWVSTCSAANDAIVETSYDLIVVDLGLPDGDGLALVREWRECGFTEPILILSARDSREDRVRGLDVGADDYLPKPFAMPELVARVRALGRRYAEEPMLSLHVADLVLDLVDHRVHRSGKPIELSARELTLLKVLMREPDRVFTRTELCERVWEHPHEYDTKLVEVFIGRLRKKIGDPPLIRTVRHVGYAICESL